MRTIAFLLLLLCTSTMSLASNPKLIVVISLDQYPYEYLTRFRPWLNGGLAMLVDGGAVFSNATYKHGHCTTGPGHTQTGTALSQTTGMTARAAGKPTASRTIP